MDFKKEIEKLLLHLKELGIDRRQIERDLDYGEFYIDQILSKGGNKKFLKRLEKYNIEKSNIVDIKIPTMTHFEANAGKVISNLIEEVITLRASVNVLVPTVSNILEVQKGKEFALVFGQLRQAIEDERERVRDKYLKEQLV